MIQYHFTKEFFKPINRFVYGIEVSKPFEFLDDIQDYDSTDMEVVIDMLNEVILNKAPDFSVKGGFVIVRIEFGANLSRIYGSLGSDKKYNIEFETKDFLKMCEDWRDFLKENGR